MDRPVIGILGDGQLAKYLIEASKKLNIKCYALGLNPGECIDDEFHITGDIFSKNDVIRFADKVDIITLENEFIPVDILEKIKNKLRPSFESFKKVENKLAEKKLAKSLGIPLVKYENILIKDLIYTGPAFYKLPKGGYDGKGNFLVKSIDDFNKMKSYFEEIVHLNIIKEEILDFEREVSVTLVRNSEGKIIYYPVVDTIQKDNICEFVSAPSIVGQKIKEQIYQHSTRLLEKINFAGVMSIEYFILRNASVYYNECSPRPHNSAHYTLDACYTSQFENHIRAIAGMEMGLGDLKHPCAFMFNLVGTQKCQNRLKQIDITQLSNGHVYDYGKREERPGRKMGHVNIVGEEKIDLTQKGRLFKTLLKEQGFTL